MQHKQNIVVVQIFCQILSSVWSKIIIRNSEQLFLAVVLYFRSTGTGIRILALLSPGIVSKEKTVVSHIPQQWLYDYNKRDATDDGGDVNDDDDSDHLEDDDSN